MTLIPREQYIEQICIEAGVDRSTTNERPQEFTKRELEQLYTFIVMLKKQTRSLNNAKSDKSK